ncbi:MAG: response regulator [Chitinophagaceae bacterium]|nr:response regulator [Oligoflexus sp.]
MREKLATRQRGVSHDRDASIIVIYLLISFALDFILFRSQIDTVHFPWLLSQALGLALIVTLGMRFWFALFLSVFANAYFIWQEGRSVTAIFLGIITSAVYTGAAWLWGKLRNSPQNVFVKALLFVGLSLLTCGLVARMSWAVLSDYELIDPVPARIWASQVTLRDSVDFLASFAFYAFILIPFIDHIVYRGTGRERQSLETSDALFALLPFLALALPRPTPFFEPLQYLLFLPAIYCVYFYRLRGAVAYCFAVHLWVYQAWPYDEQGILTGFAPLMLVMLVAIYGAGYLFEKNQNESRAVLEGKDAELSAAHKQIVEIEENRREWRALTQTLERLVIRSTQDLRTPLTPIYMWSQMLREGGTSQEILDASDGIKLSIERQTKMLEELRDSVRISMGHQHFRHDTFDLSDLLQELSVVWKEEAAKNRLEFRYERPLKSSLILGDREQLKHALQKLFEHLIQYGRDHAVMSLHATTQHRDVILHLKHSGYSSDQQHVLKLLQAGQGMDPEAFLTAANFDLSLYTAKKIIDLQDGRLTAASLDPKPGMLFSLSLKRPKRDAIASPMQPAQAQATSLPSTMSHFTPSRQRMLIVEDDPFTLHLLDSLLTGEGIEIIACANSSDAIEAFHRVHPTLILADLGLPDINGFELMRRLKKSARHDFIAVAFSACVTPEAQQQALDAGFSAFLAKPLQAKELLETMQQLQAQHHHKPFQGVDLTIN